MARLSAKLGEREAIPILEEYKGVFNTTTTVGTSAIAIPATNLSYRKAMVIQNLHASNTVYIGGSLMEIIKAPSIFESGSNFRRYKNLEWMLSTGGTDEYYVRIKGGGDPSITQPLVIYGITSAGGVETLLAEGSAVGSLNDLEWIYDDGDTLGYDTLYFKFDAGNPNNSEFLILISYIRIPDVSSNYGLRLRPNDSVCISLTGIARIFAVADAADTPVLTLELI